MGKYSEPAFKKFEKTTMTKTTCSSPFIALRNLVLSIAVVCVCQSPFVHVGRAEPDIPLLGPQKPSAEATAWLDKQKEKVSHRDADLLRRSQETLYANILDGQWRPLRGISPSPFKYRGVWNWDAAFHALAISRWDAKLAREQIQIFLDNQLPSGGMIDVIWEKEGMVVEFGKPPVMPWIWAMVDRRSPDDAYLKQAYPKFVKYVKYWEQERSGKEDGLFHYGGPMPNLEAGWDDSVRWDNGAGNLWAIDLNCYMVLTYRSMAYMADRLALPEEKKQWLAKADALGKRIDENLWDDDAKAYVDRDRESKKFSGVLTPASFMPLFVKIAPPERAKAMNALAKNPQKFFPGFPCVAYDNPNYKSEAYWRGPTWVNISYMAMKGLKRYGYDETAQTCREQLLAWCNENSDHLWEYYDSKSGKGIGAEQYGWTAAFVIEFILNWDSSDEP
jgi:putative isomerase